MRILVVAPFERGRSQGGSERATAIAERLENRGVGVSWRAVPQRAISWRTKVVCLLRRRPVLEAPYPTQSDLGECDAVLVAHSYLVPSVQSALDGRPLIVDFHNLEWRGLVDHRRLEKELGGRRLVRDAYMAAQIRLMRQQERSILQQASLNLLVSESELSWAAQQTAVERIIGIPSILPSGAELTAEQVHSHRAPAPNLLLYVGTLDFPANLMSLRTFLLRDWPAVRRANSHVELTVAGRCSDEHREELSSHPGVTAVGFVPDLTDLMARCAAVIMPFDGAAGTSLRPLFYALAGVPVIGPSNAFRDLPFRVGTVVSNSEEWAAAALAAAAAAARGEPSDPEPRVASARHQRNPDPWDALEAALSEIVAPHGGAASAGTAGGERRR